MLITCDINVLGKNIMPIINCLSRRQINHVSLTSLGTILTFVNLVSNVLGTNDRSCSFFTGVQIDPREIWKALRLLSPFKRNVNAYERTHFLLADGQILPTSRRQEVSQNGTLVLHRVDSSTDRGAYTCTAKNKQGRSDSQTIHIEVKGKVSRSCTFAPFSLCVSAHTTVHVDFIRSNWNNSVPRTTSIRSIEISRGPSGPAQPQSRRSWAVIATRNFHDQTSAGIESTYRKKSLDVSRRTRATDSPLNPKAARSSEFLSSV